MSQKHQGGLSGRADFRFGDQIEGVGRPASAGPGKDLERGRKVGIEI